MKKFFRKKKKSSSEAGSIASGLSGSGYNISPKKDLGKLHKAALDGDLTKLKSLLKRGDVNQLDKENRTPLHLACAGGKHEAVRMLTGHPNINLNLCDNDRRSALMKCVQCEQQSCLAILLDREADVSLCDVNGNTALHIAASIPNQDICYLLYDYSADPQAKNKDGAIPLHIAAGLGCDELVDNFLDARVDVNDKDGNGKTPLMHAANKGHLSTVKLLLTRKANAAIRDSKGWTADDHATMNGFHAVSHVIVEHDAKMRSATPSKQSIQARTPQTTPQRLGTSQNQFSLGGPAMDGGDDLSQSDEDLTESRKTNDKDSWASSDSEDEGARNIPAKAKPKINLIEMMKKKKTPSDASQAISPVNLGSQAPQSPSKASTNLFLTSSAREQLQKQESTEYASTEFSEDKGMRERYNSNSARGLPVSPTKPPLPQPRSSTSLTVQDTPGSKYSPTNHTKQEDEEDSPWDSTDEEDQLKPQKASPVKAQPRQTSPARPNKSLMDQLGFDENDMKDIYSEEDDDTTTEHSRSDKPPISGPVKPGPVAPVTKDGSDSWDDDDSFSEPKQEVVKQGGFNFMQKAAELKFDDETDSEPEIGKSPAIHAPKPRLEREVAEDEDSSSWNSENLVQRPEEAPTSHSYVSSSPAVIKDAERLVSPQHKTASQSPDKKTAGLQNKMNNMGIIYGETSASEEESDSESESSWEREKKSKKNQLLNNQKDLEKEEKARREEDRRKEEMNAKLEREAEEKRKKQQEEEETRKGELEKQRKREKELRDLEKLNKMNKMNEELEKQNAEHRRKIEEMEKKKQEEERERLLSLKTGPMNESLRNALERAVEATSDSGDSNPDCVSIEETKTKPKSNQPDFIKNSLSTPTTTSPTRGAPPPVSGTHMAGQRPGLGQKVENDKFDLDISTASEDDISFSENQLPESLHKSPLSDSLKLVEERQSLSMKLAREKGTAMEATEKLEKFEKENHYLQLREKAYTEDKKSWELQKVELGSERRKLSFEVKNLQETMETINLKLSRQEERCKRMEDQLQLEKEEKKEQELTIRDLRTDLKNALTNSKQLELDRDEMKKRLVNEQEKKSLTEKMDADSLNLNQLIQEETSRDKKVDYLEQQLQEKTEELIRVTADRDRYEDASARYKDALNKLRSQDADQHGNLAALNVELNEKLDESEEQRRESEEAMQLTAYQIVQYQQSHEKSLQLLAEEKRMKEDALRDLEMLNAQQTQLKRDSEDSRASLQREQERMRKLEDSHEKLQEKEADLQGKLLSAETRAGRLENDAHIAQSSNKQRTEELAKRENEYEKLREEVRENDRTVSKLQRENVELAGEIRALKLELHQRESECVQMRQEKEDLRSRSTLSVNEQQDKFNTRLTELQRQHENERVAFETRNVQLVQQVEHWKSETDRMGREKTLKDEELTQAQQDRIETHKKLGYADAFSKSASKEQQHLMEENTKFKEDNIRLLSQVSLFEQKLDEKSTTVSELQKEVDRFYQESSSATRQIDSLNQSQRLTESSRVKLEQQLKDVELENIRVKSELESAKSWKEKLQKGREEETHTRAMLEGKVSSLECDKLLIEEKMAVEVSNANMLRAEADGHRNMWEAEVKARSKASVDLSKAEKEAEEERNRADSLKTKLSRAVEERKMFKTKYEHLKKEKMESDRRVESYRVAMHDADRKVADFESDCESQISQLDQDHGEEKGRLEVTISRLREQVADLTQQVREKQRQNESIDAFTASSPIRSEELKRAQWENEKLKEELRRFRAHIEGNYVDRSELEATRQEERIKAQAALTPTLDQVNSYLKDRQLAQEVVDQLRQKNEEHRYMQAMRKIGTLEEELALLKRKNEDATSRRFQQQGAELSQLYEGSRKQNEVLQLQLQRAREKSDEYKVNLVKEKKRFQNLFSSTLGGSFIPKGADVTQFSVSNGLGLSPNVGGFSSVPLPARAFSSTPKKDPSDPLLTQLRNKLDISIAQHLAGVREDPTAMNGHAGAMSSGSSGGTPRSDRSRNQLSVDEAAGSSRQKSNEYMSFLLT